MAHEPPIFAAIERLQVAIETAVMRFPRRHRYAIGQTLRDQVMKVWSLANRAWFDPERKGRWVAELALAVDELKAAMRVGKALRAFASLGQFEDLARQAESLGRQCGGWNRQCRQDPLKGQSPARVPAQSGRAKTLSTPAASHRGQP